METASGRPKHGTAFAYEVELGNRWHTHALPLSVCLLGNFSGSHRSARKRLIISPGIASSGVESVFSRVAPRIRVGSPAATLNLTYRSHLCPRELSLALLSAGIPVSDLLPTVRETISSTEFQEVETSWRFLAALINAGNGDRRHIELSLLDTSRPALTEDFQQAGQLRDTNFYTALECETRQPFVNPCSLLIAAYAFDITDSADVDALTRIGRTCGELRIPFVFGVTPISPRTDWAFLNEARGISTALNSPGLRSWHRLRTSDDGAFLFAVAPHVLLRGPYENVPIEGGEVFTERNADGEFAPRWQSAATALACHFIEDFQRHGWCSRSGGLNAPTFAQLLPTVVRSDGVQAGPVQHDVTSRARDELAQLGIITPVACKGTNTVRFFHLTNAEGLAPAADITPRNVLSYVLLRSQFVQYLILVSRWASAINSTCDDIRSFWKYVASPLCESELSIKMGDRRCPLKHLNIIASNIDQNVTDYRLDIELEPNFSTASERTTEVFTFSKRGLLA